MRGAAFVVTLAAACSVGDLDLSGKQCPCAAGWTCDTATNICMQGAVAMDSGSDDAGSSDGAAPADGQTAGIFVLSNMGPRWATPNSIRWQWSVSGGDSTKFQAYEMVTGTSASDVQTRSGSAVVWTSAQNPELGEYLGPAPFDNGPLTWTVTDQHQPNTTYFAQLTVKDTQGGVSTSGIATTKTTSSNNAARVFQGAAMPGYSVPFLFDLSTDRPYPGSTRCYKLPGAPCGGARTCFRQAERLNLGISLAGITATDAFNNAFVEFAAAGEAALATASTVEILVGPADCPDAGGANDCHWRYQGWIFPTDDNQYRLYQIPLRSFSRASSGDPFTLAKLGNAGFNLEGFLVAGTMLASGDIRVGEIQVRW
jgi:hypothetical protein